MKLLHILNVPLLLAVGLVQADIQQHSFESMHASQLGNDTASVQITTLHLSSLKNTTQFTTLKHPHFPGHRVRVKKSNFCDPTVNVYTGYLDVDQGAKHLFFYFFESRRDPDNDDVMMWINGGPGCSSSTGLLMELGPCNIDMKDVSSNGTVWNPYGWNEQANIFFLDQPVGVGFSYADFGETVETTEDAAKDVYAFISIFFETFPQFKGRPLHLSGESYGGRYLPLFASEIVDRNTIAQAEGRPTINLKSVLIGNGITDISTLYPGRYEVECGTASLEVPFQSISTCVAIKRALPRCQKLLEEHCIDAFDAINCKGAVGFCEDNLSSAFRASGRNFYDITKPCIGDLCYPDSVAIATFLTNSTIRHEIGASVSHPTNYTSCSRIVGAAFNSHLDKYAHPTQYYVTGLLERGIRVLIYAGTFDWQCNWVANRLWVEKLEWDGQKEYNDAEWRAWTVDDHEAGITKKAGGLTFASVYGAGHMMSVSVEIEIPFDVLTNALTSTSLMISPRSHSLWWKGG